MHKAIDNLTLWERVYEHLRSEIRQHRLPPGTVLSEVALSKQLGVSRGPIREAMGRLAIEGLVTIRPRRGAVVRSITPKELIDAYQVREVLEAMAVRLAVPRLTAGDLARLEQLVEEMSRRSERGEVQRFFTANVAFHDLFCELSGNRKLVQVHGMLMGEVGGFQRQTLRLRGSADESVLEHRRILDAAASGDVERAAELAAAHVRVPSERLAAQTLYGSDVGLAEGEDEDGDEGGGGDPSSKGGDRRGSTGGIESPSLVGRSTPGRQAPARRPRRSVPEAAPPGLPGAPELRRTRG